MDDEATAVAVKAGGAGYVFLVVSEQGIFKAVTVEKLAHDTARAIEGVVAAVPIVGDYRMVGEAAPADPQDEVHRLRELLGDIWLYVDWRYVTKQLTTPQKEMWADAVDAFGEPGTGKAERWWQGDYRKAGQ